MCMPHVCAGTCKGQKGAILEPLQLLVTGQLGASWCRYWELNSGPLKEQQTLTAKSFLQPQCSGCCCCYLLLLLYPKWIQWHTPITQYCRCWGRPGLLREILSQRMKPILCVHHKTKEMSSNTDFDDLTDLCICIITTKLEAEYRHHRMFPLQLVFFFHVCAQIHMYEWNQHWVSCSGTMATALRRGPHWFKLAPQLGWNRWPPMPAVLSSHHIEVVLQACSRFFVGLKYLWDKYFMTRLLLQLLVSYTNDKLSSNFFLTLSYAHKF